MAYASKLYTGINSHLRHDPVLNKFCSLVPALGVDSRKTILAVCQDIRHAGERNLDKQLKDIQSDLRLRHEDSVPSLFDLGQMTSHIASKGIYRSFVSMVVRNEALDYLSGADETIRAGFQKEVNAGQTQREEELRISYQVLDQDNFVPAQYSIYYEPIPWWTNYAKNLIERFASRIDRIGVILPQVQRSKNMSRETCRLLWEAGYQSDRDWTSLRTLDLELHKMRTGERIQGNAEMRMAWKYNDLKPRLYYCAGGSSYWHSRYVKKIAVQLMECIESTKLIRRQHPEDIQYYLDPDDWLCIWDMTSFTTQLSELKHFLYYIAKNLEENLRLQQRPLQCLDYQLGIIDTPVHQLLLDYNEHENNGALYSILRVCDRLYQDAEEVVLEQKNSGMLGVHGNIGFSTAFHGFHLEAASKRGTGCGLGDDALAGMTENPGDRFIPHMQLIGGVHKEKTDILPPLQEYTREQVTKFVKRRFTRTHQGISLGILLAFPSLADVFRVKDEYHTLMDMTEADRISKFVAQVGALFWDIHASSELDDSEYQLLRSILGAAYKKLSLRHYGSLPGISHDAFKGRMLVAVPSLHFNPAEEDWAEHLWENSRETWALLPQRLGPVHIPPFEPGLEFIAEEGGLLNCLEDIGSIEKLRMQNEWVETTITNRRLFRSFLSGEKRSYRCRFLDFCPHWFDRVFSDYSCGPICEIV